MNVGRSFTFFFNFLAIFFAAIFVHAMNGRTTYQAKIIKPNGYPLEATNVQFRFTVLDPTAACVLYVEDYSNVNMSGSGGLISLTLGLGVRSFPTSGTLTFAQAFDNATPMFTCQSPGAYNPVPADNRRITMQFNDGNGWQTLPSMAINAVPYAMYATKSSDSLKLNNKADTAFVEYAALPNGGASCAANQALHFNGVSFTCLNVGGSYTVTASDVTTALGFTPTNAASFTALSSETSTSFTTMTSNINSVSSSISSLAASTAASLAAITSSQWASSGTAVFYNGGNVGLGTNNPQASFEVAGVGAKKIILRDDQDGVSQSSIISFEGATDGAHGWVGFASTADDDLSILAQGASGDLVLGAGNAFAKGLRIKGTTGNIGVGISAPVTRLDVAGGVRISMESATCAVSYAGTLRYNTGNVEFCNGTTWAAFGVSSAGLNSFNGSTSQTQTFASGSSGIAPAFSTANGVHTLNIPLASAAGSVTAGLISNADYVNFSNKITSSAASVAQVLGYTPASATSLGNYLAKANNLSDLTSSVTARTNLGLGTLATADSIDLGSASATGIIAEARMPSQAGVSSGSAYTKVTVDGKGRVTSGGQLSASDVATALGYTPQASGVVSSQWDTSGTTINYVAGSVGIGTSTPTRRLDVAGSINISGAAGDNSIYFPVIGGSSNYPGIIWNSDVTGTGSLIGHAYLGNNTDYGQSWLFNAYQSGNAATTNLKRLRSSYTPARLSISAHEGGFIYTTASAGASGTDITDWQTRFKITNSGNVGIGTNNPTATLSVSGNANVGLNNVVSGSYSFVAGANNQNNATGSYSVAIGYANRANGLYNVTLGYDNQLANANQQGATAIGYSNTGGVNSHYSVTMGSGNSTNSTYGITLGASLTNDSHSQIVMGRYNLPLGTESNTWVATDPLFVLGNGTNTGVSRSNALMILKNGNVGVGVTPPTARLHIAAGTSATASLKLTSGTLLTSPASGAVEYDGNEFYFTTDTRRSLTSIAAGGITVSAITSALGYTPANNSVVTSLTSTVATSFTTVTNSINAVSSSVTSLQSSVASSLAAITSSQWNTSGTTINYMAGNVGIGTTNPTGILEVYGGVNPASQKNIILKASSVAGGVGYGGNIQINAGDTTAGGYTGGNINLTAGQGFSGNGSITLATTAGIGGSGAAGGNIYLSPGAGSGAYGNVIMAASGGVVGIGNTDPDYRLTVTAPSTTSAQIALRSVATIITGNSVGGIDFVTQDTQVSGTIAASLRAIAEVTHNTGVATTGLGFSTISGTTYSEAMRIAGNGNVGVGTTTPSAKLTVSGSVVTMTNEITSGAAVNLALSNTHYLASVGGSTITLSNMVNGGVYTIIVADTTPRTYTFSGCANSYFNPANEDTESGSQTIYGITTVKISGTWRCYITWSTGFQ